MLRGHGAPSLNEDIAGTGGIQGIKAVQDADGTVRVRIEGEILPQRLRPGIKENSKRGREKSRGRSST